MTQESTLHIKVEPTMAEALKLLAKKRKKTMGELVRQAITVCYQTDFLNLSAGQSQALLAYRGGYISIGKLAEVMGMSVMSLRIWMNEHAITQNTCYDEEDAANAR